MTFIVIYQGRKHKTRHVFTHGSKEAARRQVRLLREDGYHVAGIFKGIPIKE